MSNQKITRGKWIVRYNPGEYSVTSIWELLVDIQEWLSQKHISRQKINVDIRKRIKENTVHLSNRTINFQIKNSLPINIIQGPPRNYQPKSIIFNRKIKNILLVYPVLLTDRRWLSIDLPAASLYLASALSGHSFQVRLKKLVFPFQIKDEDTKNADVIGITLYEDLFSEIEDYLIHLRQQYRGIIAAGGPMVTLNPLQTAFHLPQINLLIRGESEFIFPQLLKAIQKNDIERLLNQKGFIFHFPGMMIISDFSFVNYPRNFENLQINLDFLESPHLANGLEINVSRGCRRGCLFCSKVQGKELRKIPLNTLESILKKHSEQISILDVKLPDAKIINLNDDDILQDLEYAQKIFTLIKKNKYKLWGIQTSINSFFIKNQQINREVLKSVSDPDLFAERKSIVWLGTDVFIKKRGKKMGKMIPGSELFTELINEFEKRDILNYHYWISSDQDSSWEEFVEEVLFIFELLSRFKTFSVLAHSPFLIPYSATPLYTILIKNPAHQNQIKYKNFLKSSKEIFNFPLVDRLETRFPNLNRLLNNEKIDGKKGFFDFLKLKQQFQALKTVYSFLRQERMSLESMENQKESRQLRELESKLEAVLSGLI